MPSLQKRFLRIINDLIPNPQKSRFLVAVSGGVDSMVLCSLMHEIELSYSLAHCNFNLRGEESDKDQELVLGFTKQMHLPFFVKSFDTRQYATDMGISIEMAARELRYEWFEDLIHNQSFDFLVVAHHANDNLETALFNLAKGTGIAGLRGMKPLRDKVLRPLLAFTKEELVEFAVNNDILWREDNSNESLEFNRNFLRHEVIPQIEQVNPGAVRTYAQTSRRLLGLEKIIDKTLLDFEDQFSISGAFELPFESIEGGVNKELFVEMLLRKGFEANSVGSFLSNKEGLPGAKLKGKGYTLWRERTAWVMKVAFENETEVVLLTGDEIELELSNLKVSTSREVNVSLQKIQSATNSIFIDLDKWVFPLEIRAWKEGDRIQPFGMKGRKLISDILIDKKVPSHLKSQQYVLCSGNEILAVLGLKTSERLRFDMQIERAFKINFSLK